MTLKNHPFIFWRRNSISSPHTHLRICFKFALQDEFNPRPALLPLTLVVLYCAWLSSANGFEIHCRLAPESHGTVINSGFTSAGFTNEQASQRLKAPHQFSRYIHPETALKSFAVINRCYKLAEPHTGTRQNYASIGERTLLSGRDLPAWNIWKYNSFTTTSRRFRSLAERKQPA